MALASEHVVAQLPQWVGSVIRLASQPSLVVVLQLAKPLEQLTSPQELPAHEADAFASAQAAPHTPQFCMLVVKLISQPLATELSQLP